MTTPPSTKKIPALIARHANIANKNHKITVGDATIVHPHASLLATNGPIIIGDRNIFEEKCVIENCNIDESPLYIGDNNTFEIGCQIRASSVDNNCVFGIECEVSKGVKIESGVCISARSKLINPNPSNIQNVKEKTAVSDGGKLFRKMAEFPNNEIDQMQQIEYLRKCMPKFHVAAD